MIKDLDDTIKKLLEDNWPGTPSDSISVSFETPYDATFDVPTIDLFLYDIRENLEMRSTEWLALPVPDSPPGSPQTFRNVHRKRPRVQVDCSYIITAWTPSETAILSEHRLLSTAISILLKNRRFPNDALQGDLAVGGNTLVYRTLSLQTDYLSMGEFWQAMQGRPKVAFNYQVTLSTDISVDDDNTRVVESVVPFVQKALVIKGKVLNSASAPYPNVNVLQQVINPETSAPEYQLRATTNANGEYRGGGFTLGRHHLLFEVVGDPSTYKELDIEILADSDQPYVVQNVEL